MAWNDPKPIRDGFGNVVTDGFGNPVMNTPGASHPTDNERNDRNTVIKVKTDPDTTTDTTSSDLEVQDADVEEEPKKKEPKKKKPKPKPKEPTVVVEVGRGEVAPIDPNVSQTVTQEVAPVTYQDNTLQAIPTQQDTGTFSQPLQTAGLSAVPEQVSYKTQYAGTAGAVPQTIVSTVPGQNATYDPNQIGYQNVYYSNSLGQRIMVSEFNGQPTTYVPPGFTKEGAGYAEGGAVADWRDPDYDNTAAMIAGTATGRKPNMREMMEAMAGMPVEEIYATMPQEQWSTLSRAASGMLYGDTGQSVSDTNWETFMDDPSTRKSLRDAGDYLLSSEVKNIKRSRERQDVIDNVRDSITSRLPGSRKRPAVVTETPTQPNYLTEEDTLTVTKPGVRSPDEIVPVPRVVVPTPVQPTPVTPTQSRTGTFSQPLPTSNLSAIPEQVTYKTQYTGTAGAIPQTLVSSVPGQGGTYNPNQIGYQTVTYTNELGQSIPVSEFNGQPTTYVPPGFTKGSSAQGFAEGGDAGSRENEALYTIAKMNGYNGPKTGTALKAFFNSSDALKAKARAIGVAMAKGGAVLYAQEGTDVTTPTEEETPPAAPLPDNSGGFKEKFAEGVGSTITQTLQPQQAAVEKIQPTTADFIPVDAGATTPIAPYAEAAKVGTVEQAEMPTATPASTVEAVTAEDKVRAETEATEAAQGEVSAEAQVEAAQQTESSVSSLEAAQGEAYLIDNPVQRELQEGELISGAADAEKAAKFTEQIQAATATPSEKATVKGQLDGLMQDFEGGDTPAWAAGALRAATAKMAARGLGASSMAGQAVVQAAMESALPIAQADAATQASFEAQNLSNRQQRAMLAAQQRAQFMGQEFDQAFQARVANASKISDIANMNFTAEQQVQLENARAANTMNLANLNNNQAMVMAEAAALANLDMANLNNRQQAAVQNAQSFLEMDMANLSNQQQTSLFKAQQNIQALFTDQAAENAAAQFNATSENQTNQFFANLKSQTSQYNATQTNAMNQFNVNSVNALREFNSGLQQQRDMFNAQNGLVIAQANAQWRQNIATLNTAAQNESNMNFAKTMNALTSTNLDAYWQRERDLMSFAFTSAENAADRLSSVLLEKLSAENKAALADAQGKGTLGAVLLKGALNYMAGGIKNIV